MKALKGADFVKLTSSTESAVKLHTDLKSCLSDIPSDPSKPGQLSDQRVVCDRVLRACNHWAAESSCHGQHFNSLMPLAELASWGFYVSGAQRTPFYLEKIQFHILKNVSAQESTSNSCIQLSDLLYSYLSKYPPDQQDSGDYLAVAKSSFQCLWKASAEQEQKRGPCPYNRETLSLRLHALRFLMLVERTSSHAGSPITTHQHAKCAALAFESKGMVLSQSDACFLSQSIEEFLVKPLKLSGILTHSWAKCLLELTLERIRILSKGSCFDQSKEVLQQAIGSLNASDRCCMSALELLKFSVEIQEPKKPRAIKKRLVEVAEAVTGACSDGEGWQCQALCNCYQFAVSSLDGYFKNVVPSETRDASTLLSLGKFLGVHFTLLDKQVSMVPKDGVRQLRTLKLQQFNGLQQFSNVASSFLQNCKNMADDELRSVLDACKDTVCKMLASVNGLSGQDATEYLNTAAFRVHTLAYWFYSQKKYKEASELVSPICEYYAMELPESELELAVERLHRCFNLHVESCRKAGHTALGLTAVTLWIRALRSQVLQQMAEPVAVWVRLKIDGARNGDEDLRLHTLKDGFSEHPVEPELMASLLAEELKGYKSVHGDTGLERYNTICDLLELCAENSQLHHRRAPLLLELAQVLCYHDYSEQTEWYVNWQ